jgi:cyclic lactone autoinducer peptide
MKKLTVKICKAAAAISLLSAKVGAGMASVAGWYQPKAPDRITK